MTIKRTKVRRGLFARSRTTVSAPFSAEDWQAVKAGLAAGTPAGRIAQWRPHAERLGVALDLLDQAESLLVQGSAPDAATFFRFDSLMQQAVAVIVEAQNEASDVYRLAGEGARWTATQRASGLRRWEDQQAEHAQWRQWQRELLESRPAALRWSKKRQAVDLKERHDIAADVDTIRRQLEPRPKK